MPTFREEVEGAYELIEGALSQVTVNGVALRYIDRLPKIAVALGQPLSGPGRAANRQALLRILKRALSKFHEDKRAIAKARGEEISEYTEWMRAMVSQALLVAKEALEEDDFPFPTGNAPTGAFSRAVVGPHGSNAPWPKADRDGDVAVSGFAARRAAHLVWAKAKLAWMRHEKDKARHPREYASWTGDFGGDIDATIAHWDTYVKEEESAQGGQGGSGRRQRAGGPRAAPPPGQQQQQRQRARQHDDAARAAAAEARRRREEREEQQRQAEEEAARDADAADDAAAARDRAKPKFPDVADERSASRGIEQMDHIPWERVLFNPFQTVEEIPWDLMAGQARAVATVLGAVKTARQARDRTAEVRWLKFWRLFGQIMLRVPPRGGRRGHGILPARFAALARGDFKLLVDWWANDLEHVRKVQSQQQKDVDKLVNKAVAYAEKFCYSKAIRLLTSNGVANSNDPRIQAQMDSKFPDRKEALPGTLSGFAAFSDISDGLAIKEAIEQQTRGSGSGPDGMRPEYFHALKLSFSDSHAKHGLTAFSEYAALFAANELPVWYYYAVTACTLIPIIKEPVVNPAQVPDARPVQMGNVELRIIGRAVCNLHEVPLREFYEPQQLGASTDGGLDVLVHLVRMHLETHPRHVIVKLDIKNMFNEVTRAAMIRVFERHPDLRSMVPFLFATHSPKSPVFYASGKHAKPCAEGSRQGAAEAGIAASAAIQEPLESADEALATACEGFARADFDDTYLCGEPAAVAQALADFETAIALVGATLQRPKSAALRGAECELPGDFPVPLGVHKRAADRAVVGYGIKVAGIPVGDDAYVKAKLEEKADKLDAKFARVTGRLEKGHQFQLFHMLRSCLRPTGDYFARLLFPDDAEPLMKRIDELVVRTKQACFGQDVSADGPLGPVGADLHQQQSEFPKRMNGIGLRSLFKKSQSVDFVAALLDALPKFLDSTDGSKRGLANWLAPVLGADSFEKCNYNRRLAPFLANGGRTAAHFRECWERSVTRAGAIPHDGTAPSANPLEWPIEMAGLGAGPEFQLMVQTQRALTLACEAHEWAALDKKFRDLPPLDPILGEMRMAWLNNGRESLVWSSCIASRQYCNGNQQFRQIVAQTMGLPSGACKPYVGQPVACKGQGRKLLDPHGHVLGTVSLPGGARDIRHREIQLTMVSDLNYNGIPAIAEPRNMVNSWMTPAAFDDMNRREGNRPLQGCIPDILTTEPRPGGGAPIQRLYDFKAINQCKTRYKPTQTERCEPVNKRAAEIPDEYIKKLREKDRRYHNTANGEVGPMEEALMSYDGCSGLVGGFYGEFSKDVDRLIKLAAQEGAELHAAKYGLESSKQIRSVLANKIRTNWAMALARGNADVILSNLRFVRGGAADEDRYGQFSDQHSRWNKKREEYRYAYEEFRGPRMGGFGGRHCR